MRGDLGFAAIRFNTVNQQVERVTMIAIEQITACIPGDIFYAAPLINGHILPIETLPVQPAIPQSGEKVYSCGYTNFDYDHQNGLPLDKIISERFNWRDGFSFDFMVYEGVIEDIYINNFVGSYLNAPCFSVDYGIPPGLSGGPTLNENGVICGVNSASLADQSLISLIYPTVFVNLKTKLRLGTLTVNNDSPIIKHMSFGNISTDGSEKKIRYAMEHDKHCVYHQWAEHLNSRVYENRNDQESKIPAKPRK